MNTISITIIIVAMAIWMIVSTSIMNDHTHEIKDLKNKIKVMGQLQLISILKEIDEDGDNDNNKDDKEMTDDTIIS